MTKADFEAVTAALRAAYPKNHSMKLGYWLAISAMATGLERTNPRFDRRRFVESCRLPGEVFPDDAALRQGQLEFGHEGG